MTFVAVTECRALTPGPSFLRSQMHAVLSPLLLTIKRSSVGSICASQDSLSPSGYHHCQFHSSHHCTFLPQKRLAVCSHLHKGKEPSKSLMWPTPSPSQKNRTPSTLRTSFHPYTVRRVATTLLQVGKGQGKCRAAANARAGC